METYHACSRRRPRYKTPPVIVGCEGCYLIDQTGHRYLDCTSGGGVMNAGYRNPMILNAVVDQLWRLQHAAADCLTEQTEELAATLAELTAGALSGCLFFESEGDARQAAVELAAMVTERHAPPTPAPGVFPAPEEVERCIVEADASRLPSLVGEPTFLEEGVLLPPEPYWRRIRDLGHQNGALLIFDETRTGMNRTGRWFAGEHWGVWPDILILGAALTNGVPCGAVLTTEEIAARCRAAEHFSSPISPVACTAAMATIRFHRTAALAGRGSRYGEKLLHEVRGVVERGTHFARPRGLGLLLAVDVVNDDGEPDSARCDQYLEQLKDWGFLLGKAGKYGNVLTIMPPLTITEEQLPLIAGALAEVDRAAPAANGREAPPPLRTPGPPLDP